MNCYECDHEERPAVAVCRICGKGVCRDHSVALARCVYEHVSAGMATQLRLTGKRVGMIVCAECAAALGDSELEEKLVVTSACCPPRADRR